jgi:hypothetical protein
MVHMMMNTIGLNYRNDLSRKFNRKKDLFLRKKSNELELWLTVRFVR